MVAETMGHSIRSSDCLARWGGEEFVVVIQEIDREQLLAIANKLRTLVASSFFSVGRDKVQVTVSIGATFGQAGDTPETIIQLTQRHTREACPRANRERMSNLWALDSRLRGNDLNCTLSLSKVHPEPVEGLPWIPAFAGMTPA